MYKKGGTYTLFVRELEAAGEGDLSMAFELLKSKLRDEGLFDAAHKRPIPAFPRKIAIITSPTGCLLYTSKYRYGVHYTGELGQIYRQMPVTSFTMSICAFSMIGLPPFAGFFSKWYLALGAIENGQYIYCLLYPSRCV